MQTLLHLLQIHTLLRLRFVWLLYPFLLFLTLLHEVLLLHLPNPARLLRVSMHPYRPLPARSHLIVYLSWLFCLVVFFLAALLNAGDLFAGEDVNVFGLGGYLDGAAFGDLFFGIFLFIFEDGAFGSLVGDDLEVLADFPAFPVDFELLGFEGVQFCVLKAEFLGLAAFLKLFLLSLHF